MFCPLKNIFKAFLPNEFLPQIGIQYRSHRVDIVENFYKKSWVFDKEYVDHNYILITKLLHHNRLSNNQAFPCWSQVWWTPRIWWWPYFWWHCQLGPRKTCCKYSSPWIGANHKAIKYSRWMWTKVSDPFTLVYNQNHYFGFGIGPKPK